MPAPRHQAASIAASSAERLLQALGADPGFVENVFGDLAEEYAERAARHGVGAARWWYVRETVRAVPHLVASAVRHAVRHDPARLAWCGAGMLVTSAVVALLLSLRAGPPARLLAGSRDDADGVVVNSLRPVQLPVRVLDRAGHLLTSGDVRYAWASGAPVSVSPNGVVTCARRGDATVRASLGALVTRVDVRCRPVRALQASTWISLVAGAPARHLPFRAIGVDGSPVMQLRGAVRVLDSSVATLVGASVRPRSVGETTVAVRVGDRGALMRVMVHEPVRTFTDLRPRQRLVAVPVRLGRGDTARWALPAGAFWLEYIPRREGEPPPTIVVHGLIGCTSGDGLGVYLLPFDVPVTYCVVHAAGASVTVAHGRAGAPVVDGWLALARANDR